MFSIVNPEFDFDFQGTIYRLRKATLDKIVQFKLKFRELNDTKDADGDIKLLAYAIYIMLKDKNPDITLDFVMQNTPLDFEITQCLQVLGFINPNKTEANLPIQKEVNPSTSQKSSSSLQNDSDGQLVKPETFQSTN